MGGRDREVPRIRRVVLGVRRLHRGRDRARRGRVESVDGAVIALVLRQLFLHAQSDVQREVGFHAPVVMKEVRHVIGLVGSERIDLEVAVGGQSQQESGHVLTERRAGGVIQRAARPVLAQRVTAAGVAVTGGALPQQPQVRADLETMLALHLHDVGEDLVDIERGPVTAISADILDRVEIEYGQHQFRRGCFQNRRKSQAGEIETVAGLGVALDEARVVQPDVQHGG